MYLKAILFFVTFLSYTTHAQIDNSSPNTSINDTEVNQLKDRIRKLEQIQDETSAILKRQLGYQHFYQNSPGYLELKFGMSMFSPKDINDANYELFSDTQGSRWEEFQGAYLIDLGIGKSILSKMGFRHEIGIGYQHLRSKADARFKSGANTFDVYETVSIHTLFGRYAFLIDADNRGKFFIGPGVTFGYSPSSELKIEIEGSGEGAQIRAEGNSYLVELFGKAKYEFSRYFSLVAFAGYRIQEAENLRLNAADLVTVNTKADLDASGFFGSIGFSVAF